MRNRQRGVALLIIALILSLATVGFFFSKFSARNIEQERAAETAAALGEAKAALIGRALTDLNRPGSLPCPDTNNDGSPEILDGSDCRSYIGRLPWRTLGLTDLRDGSGERLWYALSRNFRDAPGVSINSDTFSQLSVGGSSPAANVIAIVFAPGPTLSGQARDAPNANNLTNYLEGSNASGSTNANYTTAIASSTFNDRLLAITNDNLLPIVEKRVARELASMLRAYASTGNYLFAALLSGSSDGVQNNRSGRIPRTAAPTQPNWSLPAWVRDNNWDNFIYYSFAPPGENLIVDATNVTAIIIAAGRRLNSTTCETTDDSRPQDPRPSSNICDYLDSTENTNGDNTYRTAPPSSIYNDQIFILAP